MKQTQNQFYGKHSEMPNKLPPGSIYVCSDHDVVFISKSDGEPIAVGGGVASDLGFSSVKKILIEKDYYDLKISDGNSLLDFKFNGDWGVILPLSSSVPENFRAIISHDGSSRHKGEIVPYNGELINGFSSIELYGSGFVNIHKTEGKWVISNKSLFNNRRGEGESNIMEFNNESIVSIEHDFGYIPIVQVWAKIGEGENDYVLSSAKVVHDWGSKNSFQLLMDSPQSGKIIYL
tara:strand:- start:178 stop:879 length:702 start_codon:yes stop_codon:yes gene_type:complete